MIRGGKSSDSAALGRIYCEAWKTAYRGIMPDEFLTTLTPRNCMPPSRHISQDNCFVYVADGEIVGLVNFGPGRDIDMPEIRSIYMLPEYWGKGAGTALFRAAEEAIKASGAHSLHLWTLTDNARACRFYEHMGMHECGGRTINIGGCELSEIMYQKEY